MKPSRLSVAPGRIVGLAYTLRDADDVVHDARPLGNPLRVLWGSGALPGPLEATLDGANAGDFHRLTFGAERPLFGLPDPEAVLRLPRPDHADLRPGEPVEITLPGGTRRLGFVQTLDATHLLLDLNHPLAGRDLILDVVVAVVEGATHAELEAGAPLGPEEDRNHWLRLSVKSIG